MLVWKLMKLGNKKLQYTYYSISEKVNAVRQSNVVSLEYNIWNNFLGKSYTKCDVEVSPKPSLNNQNWAYLWINILNIFTVCWSCNY